MLKCISNADIAKIPGWFRQPDIDLFRLLLDETSRDGGDLAELGVYLGRSAVLLGASLNDGETLTVVDTFGAPVGDDENQRENDEQYSTLTRAEFEANYRAVLGDLPVVIQGLSSIITDHAAADSHRLVHVDASHLYENVVTDIESARTLLKPEGVVIFDDYQCAHTPGVAAAAWQAVGEGLQPFALTGAKMYATWGNPKPYFDAVGRLLAGDGAHYSREVQQIGHAGVHRVWTESRGRSKYVPPVLLPAIHRAYERVKISRGR